jgi:5'-phosphate synthase pdxT subunit
MRERIKIGVLALQGDFKEHIHILRQLDTDAVEVRLPGHIQKIDALIIPGGESTTIGKLAYSYNLIKPLRKFASLKPVWGTCAGMIFLAKNIDTDQPLLGVMDIEVQRNAFGRQVDSFTTDLVVPVLNNGQTKPYPAIFIRAPKIVKVNGKAKVVAKLSNGTAVAAQEEKWLATSFHPELTDDNRFHTYFINLVKDSISS